MENKIRKIIKQELFKLQDENYKKFQSGLCPDTKNIIGVRVPILRSYAKELLKKYSFTELMEYIDDEYYEEIMLQGMLIGLVNENYSFIIPFIEKFVPKINNWAICDTFCSSLKITKKNKKDIWNFIQKYLKSKNEFEIRFGVVMIIDYYIEKEYLKEIFKIFDSITNKAYYVQMAVAWAISICLVKYYNETLEYLKKSKIDNFTYNKALQKAIESYRITTEQKNNLKNLKK